MKLNTEIAVPVRQSIKDDSGIEWRITSVKYRYTYLYKAFGSKADRLLAGDQGWFLSLQSVELQKSAASRAAPDPAAGAPRL